MTVTSWSFRPSQCSSCRESSWPLLTLLTLAGLARSRPPRLGLLEGEAADSAKTTFFTLVAPLKPLLPPLEAEEEEVEESRGGTTRETPCSSPSAHHAGTLLKTPLPLWGQPWSWAPRSSRPATLE